MMDRSLDEMIAERPRQGRRGRGNQGSSSTRRDSGKKPYREPVDLNRDWVHDKFEDDPQYRGFPRDIRPRRERSPDRGDQAKLRIDNLHYDLTEDDLHGLFSEIGPVTRVRIQYDRAGRSEGVAHVTYKYLDDAKTAIREFDGANAKGQPIKLTLVSTANNRGGRNLFDRVEKPQKSLFDRIERPRDRSERSLSPMSEDDDSGDRGRRDRRAGRRRAPPHIDRYVPGQRSPPRRRGGRRRGPQRDAEGRPLVNGRPRKTQEELDQEMEDYWENAPRDQQSTQQDTGANPANAPAPAPASAAPAGDDDVEMIE